MRYAPLPILVLALLAGGCAGRGIDAPSLSPRAVEAQSIPLPDDASEPATPLDPALAARIAAIEAAALAGDAAFQTARARVAAAVARAAGQAAGSEAWTIAQQELSALGARRDAVTAASADLDALRREPANLGAGNRAAIEAAGGRIQALANGEAAAMAALTDRLAR